MIPTNPREQRGSVGMHYYGVPLKKYRRQSRPDLDTIARTTIARAIAALQEALDRILDDLGRAIEVFQGTRALPRRTPTFESIRQTPAFLALTGP